MFEKGHKKTGGRVKGTPNKTSLKVLDQLLLKGKHPIEEILRLLPHADSEKQLDVWVKLMSYCYPTFKSVELTGDQDRPLVVTTENVAQLCKIAREAQKEGIAE